MTGFEHVLPEIRKGGARWRRMAWKPNKFLALREPGRNGDSMMSFIAIVMPDGSYAPWTPTRCDLLEQDWTRYDGT